MQLLELLLLAFGVVVLLFQGVAIVLAYETPRIEPTKGRQVARKDGMVSAVIAARNEAGVIGACLDGLLGQSYPLREIVVVDGGSSDGTREIAGDRPRIRLIEEPPLPPGWVGKNWACHTGARATESTYLLFTDADVRYEPDAVAVALEWAEHDGADLVSLGARIETSGFWDGVVMPFYTQMVLTYFRAPHVNRPNSSAAIANGQFLLVRRAVYDLVGGHRALAGFVLEDVELARRFRAAGRVMRFGWAPGLLSTRMYDDRHEMFEGLLKSVHDTRFSLLRQLGLLAGLLVLFLLPLAILPIGLALGSLAVSVMGLALWVALFGKHIAFARAIGEKGRYGLMFPLAVAFYVALVSVSIGRGLLHRPLRWKGREYALAPGPGVPGSPPTP